MILHKKLTEQEALEAILYSILIHDFPKDFKGNFSASFNDEGEVEIYVDVEEQKGAILS